MNAHQSVLLQEAIEGLSIKPDGIYIDGTFGRGGHSQLILKHLNSTGRLFAIDKDPDAVAHAKKQFADDQRFTIIKQSFAKMGELAASLDISGNVDGILLDLGVSSPQLDMASRGFSFTRPGPLDMRMDSEQRFDASTFVNQAKEDEMASIFKTYGEERFARRIAKAIVKARAKAPILTTEELSEIVKAAHPKWEKHKHPATRVFQAIRIHVNQELTDLDACLSACVQILSVGGRLVVISFHSLEDRLVKQFMRYEASGRPLPAHVPLKASELNIRFKRIGKAIKPHEEELKRNIRARSAVLRIGEKIA